MIAEIGAGISSLKAALDIAKGLNAAAGTAAVNDAKIALQSTILEAQSNLLAAQEAQSANLKRIDELEAEIVKLGTWEGEKQRYQLEEFPTGAFAYVLKEGDAAGEPMHRLCARCFNEGHKSILQTYSRRNGMDVADCPLCKSRFRFADGERPRVEYGKSNWMG